MKNPEDNLISQITGGMEASEVKKSQGIRTGNLVKTLLQDIGRARPGNLNSRKNAIFRPNEKREQSLATELADNIQYGTSSRFEWQMPEKIAEPVPVFVAIATRLLAKSQGINLRFEKNTKDLDAILD